MAEALKDHYNRDYIQHLAEITASATRRFDRKGFVAAVLDEHWAGRELKARMHHIRWCLHDFMKLPYHEAVTVLSQVAPHFGGYHGMFVPDYVEHYGLANWEVSLPALALFTCYSSSEFAVRPFIREDPERMMAQMVTWAGDANPHVRRLSSEGCRPRLPWAQALPLFKADPHAILPILDRLRDDQSLYVRKSVANNLNDIAKDNPEVVLDWGERWYGTHPHTDWIIKKGYRTLLKQAHPRALSLFELSPADHLQVTCFRLDSPAITIGDSAAVEVTVTGKQPFGRLRLEYGIDFYRPGGGYSRKLFKLAEGDYSATEMQFRKRHSFRQMSTRRHYPGPHRVSLIINGEQKAQYGFELIQTAPASAGGNLNGVAEAHQRKTQE